MKPREAGGGGGPVSATVAAEAIAPRALQGGCKPTGLDRHPGAMRAPRPARGMGRRRPPGSAAVLVGCGLGAGIEELPDLDLVAPGLRPVAQPEQVAPVATRDLPERPAGVDAEVEHRAPRATGRRTCGPGPMRLA